MEHKTPYDSWPGYPSLETGSVEALCRAHGQHAPWTRVWSGGRDGTDEDPSTWPELFQRFHAEGWRPRGGPASQPKRGTFYLVRECGVPTSRRSSVQASNGKRQREGAPARADWSDGALWVTVGEAWNGLPGEPECGAEAWPNTGSSSYDSRPTSKTTKLSACLTGFLTALRQPDRSNCCRTLIALFVAQEVNSQLDPTRTRNSSSVVLRPAAHVISSRRTAGNIEGN